MAMNQISLLEKEKDRAIYAAGAFADSEWKKAAEECVRTLCRLGEDFDTDRVWGMLDQTGLHTPEPRALGAVMQKFARERAIVPSGGYRKSTRRACHRRNLCIWRPVNYRKNLREAE